jgi:enoyl-CoA hydratase
MAVTTGSTLPERSGHRRECDLPAARTAEGNAVILQERRDRVSLITLNRPEKHNALNASVCDQLREAVEAALAEGSRAIVLTGNGKSFCAGADLDEVYSPGLLAALRAVLQRIVTAPVPVIAAVNGPAIGGGTQIAIAADFRVVAPTARFGVPPAKIGVAVDPWTVRRLAMLGGNTARTLLLAAEQVDVDGALACGLADRTGSLDDAVEWAQAMAELAPLTLAYTKLVLNDAEPAEESPHIVAAFEEVWASQDREEGRLARLERRAPNFQGK